MKKILVLLVTHAIAAGIGFAVGIYALPILTAAPAATETELSASQAQAEFTGEFIRDLQDSDAWHWGEGTVTIGQKSISFDGKLSAGPDYYLYLSKGFVETEAEFERLRSTMQRIGTVKNFDRFVLSVPSGVDPADYNTVIIWCESFSEFITAAQYRE